MSKLTLTTAATAVLIAGAALAQSVPMVGGAPMFPQRNIVENAVNSADHTTLVAAVQAAGLVETLMGEGPFTVFAPVNDAFAALPQDQVARVLEPRNRDRLTEILTCHVIAGEAFSSDLAGMIRGAGGSYSFETVGGCTFTATMRGSRIMIEDEQGRMATVTQADVDQSNGVIHVIDAVLLPDAM
ncbi:fasciclin domain-containing protein [Roseicyclus persicicus]|uniref:Fasciclin domain-containing protein n=1 Tax=Roseicyclus persicicus TaxID=2650661 RepID=A0A7X6GZA9_9RHOB|nr:fasciclin domain-containing protein [Roseibacterium persicicum]NKX43882.1 fasciclin domain-containing protein [Roseibacterium persicicum]